MTDQIQYKVEAAKDLLYRFFAKTAQMSSTITFSSTMLTFVRAATLDFLKQARVNFLVFLLSR